MDLARGPQNLNLVLNHEREVFQPSRSMAAQPRSIPRRPARRRKLTGLNIVGIPYSSRQTLRNTVKLMPGVVQDARGGLHFSGQRREPGIVHAGRFQCYRSADRQFRHATQCRFGPLARIFERPLFARVRKGSAGVLAINTNMGDDTPRHSATNFVPGVDTKGGLHMGTWSPRFGLTGPIVKGRAWYSESIESEYSTLIVPGLPKNERQTSSLRLGELLRAQVNLTPSQILFGSFLMNSFTAPETNLGPLDPPSTTIGQRARTWFFSVKDQAYLARDTLLEFGFAQDRTFARLIPQGQALYRLTPNGRAGNFYVDSTETSRRDQFLSNLFLPSFQWAGRHQFKIGSDLDRVSYQQNTRRTGYELWGLDGYLLHRTTFGGSGAFRRPSIEMSSYVLDTWRIRPNLTADIGVRQDWDELIRHTTLSPRLSFAYSPFASRSTRISGGYAVTCDETSLVMFTRPLDQYAVNTSYDQNGTVTEGPSVTLFTMSHARLKAPTYRNWTLAAEQQLPGKLATQYRLSPEAGKPGICLCERFRAGNPPPPGIDGTFDLTNLRRDTYDSAEVSLRQPLGDQYEWMASYTRSRAQSNSVLDISVDQPLSVANNVGPMPWDSPNRLLSWFYLPTPWKKWALAGLLEARDGYPFSIQSERGAIVGAINSAKYPMYFNLNLHLEYRFPFRGHNLALRAGFNNITNHNNYTAVNNTFGSPAFLAYYGSDGRHFVVRIRWLGAQAERPADTSPPARGISARA